MAPAHADEMRTRPRPASVFGLKADAPTQVWPTTDMSAGSYADLLPHVGVLSISDAADLPELLDIAEAAVFVAIFDDAASEHLADARQLFELFGSGGVEIDDSRGGIGWGEVDRGGRRHDARAGVNRRRSVRRR